MGYKMNEKLFKETFSAIHASERIKTEVLQMNTQKREPKIRGTLRLALAIVAIVCILTTTVFAATVVYKYYNANINDSYSASYDTDENGISKKCEVYELSFEFEMKDDAPLLIEEYYVPLIPDVYEQSFGYAYGGLGYDRLATIIYAWDVPSGEKQGIMFYQHSVEGFEGGRTVIGNPDREPEMISKELGGVEGLLILAPDETEIGRKYFYWSNGDYVFEMKFPYDFSDEEMSQIISGVVKVEDITSYLISMTDEEIRKTFE